MKFDTNKLVLIDLSFGDKLDSTYNQLRTVYWPSGGWYPVQHLFTPFTNSLILLDIIFYLCAATASKMSIFQLFPAPKFLPVELNFWWFFGCRANEHYYWLSVFSLSNLFPFPFYLGIGMLKLRVFGDQ
jgi:hypothetical protein